MDKNIEKIIGDLSKEMNLDYEIVRTCMKTASLSLVNQMRSLEAPVILWPRLGTFSLNPKKIKEEENLESFKEYKAKFKKFPFKGKKRHSPMKVNTQELNMSILDKIDKALDEMELIRNREDLI